MRAAAFTLATVLAAALSSSAQSIGSIPGIPACARPCIGSFGSCGGFNADCICNDKPLIADLACCVSVSCDQQGQKDTLDFAQGICQAYNADLPSSASCAPGAQSTPAGTSTVSAGSTATPTTGASSSATTSASESESTAASGSSSAAAAEQTENAGRKDKLGPVLGLAAAGLFAAI